MGYQYQIEKKNLFTEDGMKMLIKVRDHVQKCLKLAGAVRMQEVMNGVGTGDTWMMLSCVDFLVEQGELREVIQNQKIAGQERVFVSTKNNY